MTTALLAFSVVLAASYPVHIVAFFMHLKARAAEERLERAAISDRHDAQLEAHRAQIDSILAGHRQEVAALCQRIQAPEVAVMQHQMETAGPGEAILPLTDEEAAERENALRVAIDEIERLENESVLP